MYILYSGLCSLEKTDINKVINPSSYKDSKTVSILKIGMRIFLLK